MSEDESLLPGAPLPDRDAAPTERMVSLTESFVLVVELAAAGVFALLFAIGVVDLGLRIGEAFLGGRITNPAVVVGIIDTGLLLLIIVEVYQTVMAYIRRSDTRRIVRLILYTGIIAMARKVIIFRTDAYASTEAALFAALAYTVILGGLAVVLLVERAGESPANAQEMMSGSS